MKIFIAIFIFIFWISSATYLYIKLIKNEMSFAQTVLAGLMHGVVFGLFIEYLLIRTF